MFDRQDSTYRRKIAIIGGGISGLSAAYYLSAEHEVTLFEAENRLGGHARTVLAGKNGDQPVDTGFIVFNYATYPHLTRLFQDLDVPVIPTKMSFGACIDEGRIEYGINSLKGLTAQKRNLLYPQYYKMIADIIRFGHRAEQAAKGREISIRELVQELKLGKWFQEYYLWPICGAIWSTPAEEIDRFPAEALIRFFRNHSLLVGSGHCQWWTVKGGSVEYVRRLETALIDRGCSIRKNAPIEALRRTSGNVEIAPSGMGWHGFDDVIFACHSDQALRILGDSASPEERETLGAIRYQPNRALLHRDTNQMPKHRACWSSWVYQSRQKAVGVTYWMNNLQSIPEKDPLFVTLNPSNEIPENMIYDEVEFSHPLFDQAALDAQKKIQAMQGRSGLWFAGAYNRFGFHEDGIASAMRVIRKMKETTNINEDASYEFYG